MYFSIIIPTLNRPHDLQKTLDTIMRSSVPPEQIIIIDQSHNAATKLLVDNMDNRSITYHHLDITSSAKARNFGIDRVHPHVDIVIFLDDDVSVDLECFAQVITYMKQHHHITGGLLNIHTPNRSISLTKKIGGFLLTASIRFDEQFVSKGGFNAMFFQQPIKEKPVQRCSGCGMFFRKKVLDDGFRFPQHFEKYSLMEDVFFSYAIHKQYPNSLHYIPNAKIIHHESPIRSVPPRAKIMQNIVHRFLFVQEFKLSYIGYVWTVFILGIFDLITYKKISVLSRYIQGILYVAKHRKILSLDGNLLDYNTFIFQK